MTEQTSAPIVIIMGVSGTGKTTLGKALRDRFDLTFLDADDFHSSASVEKMRAGIALTDGDREPWLRRLAFRLVEASQRREGVALACSALKESYREILTASLPQALLVHLEGTRDVIASRLGARADHYMPVALVDSQFETLEPPKAGDNLLVLDCSGALSGHLNAIATRLDLQPGGTAPLQAT